MPTGTELRSSYRSRCSNGSARSPFSGRAQSAGPRGGPPARCRLAREAPIAKGLPGLCVFSRLEPSWPPGALLAQGLLSWGQRLSALKWQRGATVDSSLGVSPTGGAMPRTRSACYVFGLVAWPIHFPCHSPVQFSSPLPRLAADGSPAPISEPRDRVYAAFVRTERLRLLLGTRSLPRLRRVLLPLGRVHARQAHFHFSLFFFF